MTRTLRGVPAAPGVAIAFPWVYRPPSGGEDRVPLDEAVTDTAERLGALAGRLREAGREDEAGILEAQGMMAQDQALLDAARRHMAEGKATSDAILTAGEEQAQVLASLDDPLLAARAADVRDVAERIARAVRGQQLPPLERRSIAVAADLPPSVTAELDPSLLAGIALEAGSPTAHAAILARALGIPAVVAVSGLLTAVAQASDLAVDGGTGEVSVDPDPEDRRFIEAAERATTEQRARDLLLRDRPLATADGHRLVLAANIGHPQEATKAVADGAEAVGLFRTEFMFMGRSRAPGLEEQTAAYLRALTAFGSRPVVFRMLDIGGDKRLPYLKQPEEENPFLGVRAIRLAAENRDLLVTQLRAIVQAAATADTQAWIMAPMVADLADVRLVRELVAEAAEGADGQPPKVGIMVELPAAATLADQLAAEVDFFSIGTNDLTQYLLAVDRTNPALAGRQDPMHPAVLRNVRAVAQAADARGIGVAVCGEMAGDPVGAVTLAGLGVHELSMDHGSFGAVKRALASVTHHEAADLAARACQAPSAAAARDLVGAALTRQAIR